LGGQILVLIFDLLDISTSHRDPAEGNLAAKLDAEATLHELLVHFWVINGQT